MTKLLTTLLFISLLTLTQCKKATVDPTAVTPPGNTPDLQRTEPDAPDVVRGPDWKRHQ